MTETSHDLLARVRSEWRMKLWLGTALGAFFLAGYFTIQRAPLRTPVVFELSAIDRWAGFHPAWAAVYVSLYPMLPLAWLATTRQQLWRYAGGFLGMTVVGFAVFLAWPVAGPRPLGAPVDGLYAALIRMDNELNTFPSLHVALATYTTCFCSAVLGRRARAFALVMWSWLILICWSTLATQQHYFVDLPPGALLGVMAHVLAWRWPAARPQRVAARFQPQGGTA